jgi:5-methylcytosine-specific restriction endonuclease McrA
LDKKFQAKIVSALRKLTKQWPPILQSKKKAKIGPELYQCPKCNDTIYTGARSIDVIQLQYPTARVGKMDVDHIEPIMAVEDSGKEKDWNKVIQRMFCAEENLQTICSRCHKFKSNEEKKERAKARKLNNGL